MAWTCLWHFGIRPVVGAVLFAALVSLSWGDQRVVCHNDSLPEPMQMRPVPGAANCCNFWRRFGNTCSQEQSKEPGFFVLQGNDESKKILTNNDI